MTHLQKSLYEFRPLNRDNLDNVKLLHDELLPIKYSEKFYKALLNGTYKSLLLYTKECSSSLLLIGVSSWKIEYREQDGVNKRVQVGYLATFGIRKSFRKRGLGKYLLFSTLSMMKDMQCKLSELHVLSSNIAATNLYVKCGYIIRMKLPNHYHFNDNSHDALLLIKSLKSIQSSYDTESDTEYNEDEESKSFHDNNNRERSPPYYTTDVNVEFGDKYIINEPSIDSIDDNNTTVLPISNWISYSVDSLWIKCIIL